MQQRSTPHFEEVKRSVLDSGLIGKVNMVRTIWNANRGYLTPVPKGFEQKPDGLDWDACLAWLSKIPWDAKRYFNRFAYWDLSTGGQTGGLFVHMVDVVHWFLNIERPAAAVASGGIYLYDDGRDTPDNVNFALEYPEKLNVTFEATLTDMIPTGAADIVFMGTGGRLNIFRWGYKFTPAKENAQVGELSGAGTDDYHMANWLDCMRSRKQPNADVTAGHYSSTACHIGNLAYKQKSRAVWQKEWDLVHVHAKDIAFEHSEAERGKVTGTPVGCACGDGVIDWKKVIEILREGNYQESFRSSAVQSSRRPEVWLI